MSNYFNSRDELRDLCISSDTHRNIHGCASITSKGNDYGQKYRILGVLHMEYY